MLIQIYECANLVTDFILSLVIARYVFLIPPLKKVSYKILFLILSALVCVSVLFLTHFSLLFAVIGVYCCLTASSKKILHFLLCIPLTGIAKGVRMPLSELPVLLLNFSNAATQIYTIAVDSVLLLVYMGFLIWGRKWRKRFREEMDYRRLKSWERYLLYIVGVLMFVFAPILTTYRSINEENYMVIAEIIGCGLSSIAFVVTLTVITLILQGNKRAYFQEQVVQMQHNIIVTMADMVENRDQNTGGHVKRTARYVEIIANQLLAQGKYRQILTKRYVADTIAAAPLHDMGKIQVPDSILNKPGNLTHEEFTVMQNHTIAGKKILMQTQNTLGGAGFLGIAAQMAESHHEKWDGTGYPNGISGQDIPLCARIMAVADVFDALVSRRCYKEKLSVSNAYEILRMESGTHFDPTIVDAFLAASEQIESVLTEVGDDE